MAHEITKRDMEWATIYELHLEGWRSPLATLTFDRRTMFGEPSAPAINWSATGSQAPEITRAFAQGLLDLCEIEAAYSKVAESDSKKNNGLQP